MLNLFSCSGHTRGHPDNASIGDGHWRGRQPADHIQSHGQELRGRHWLLSVKKKEYYQLHYCTVNPALPWCFSASTDTYRGPYKFWFVNLRPAVTRTRNHFWSLLPSQSWWGKIVSLCIERSLVKNKFLKFYQKCCSLLVAERSAWNSLLPAVGGFKKHTPLTYNENIFFKVTNSLTRLRCFMIFVYSCSKTRLNPDEYFVMELLPSKYSDL